MDALNLAALLLEYHRYNQVAAYVADMSKYLIASLERGLF